MSDTNPKEAGNLKIKKSNIFKLDFCRFLESGLRSFNLGRSAGSFPQQRLQVIRPTTYSALGILLCLAFNSFCNLTQTFTKEICFSKGKPLFFALQGKDEKYEKLFCDLYLQGPKSTNPCLSQDFLSISLFFA